MALFSDDLWLISVQRNRDQFGDAFGIALTALAALIDTDRPGIGYSNVQREFYDVEAAYLDSDFPKLLEDRIRLALSALGDRAELTRRYRMHYKSRKQEVLDSPSLVHELLVKSLPDSTYEEVTKMPEPDLDLRFLVEGSVLNDHWLNGAEVGMQAQLSLLALRWMPIHIWNASDAVDKFPELRSLIKPGKEYEPTTHNGRVLVRAAKGIIKADGMSKHHLSTIYCDVAMWAMIEARYNGVVPRALQEGSDFRHRFGFVGRREVYRRIAVFDKALGIVRRDRPERQRPEPRDVIEPPITIAPTRNATWYR